MLITDEELKNLILKTNLTDKAGMVEIEEYIKNTGSTLYEAVIERNIATDEKLGILISDYLKLPFVVLAKIPIPGEIYRIVPERLARKKKVVCFGLDDNGIKLAMVDPKNQAIINSIAKKTNKKVNAYLATEKDITGTFHIYQKDLQATFNRLIEESSTQPSREIPIIKIVDLIVSYASQDKASDIHIEPQEKDTVVRYRIDGMLHDIFKLPVKLHDRIITRIKVLSRLRTDEHLAAQDGKMRFNTEDETMDIRVSILPIVDGEKVVMRLLSTHDRQFSLADLGMSESDLKKLTKAMKKSYGMILSTGPTGSGKSTSIYSILKIINRREKNITTIEDPVEYRIKGVNQINATRQRSDVLQILNAVHQFTAENNGQLPGEISALVADTATVLNSTNFPNLCGELMTNYIPALPVIPTLNQANITSCTGEWNTGYTISRDAQNRVTVSGGTDAGGNTITVTR